MYHASCTWKKPDQPNTVDAVKGEVAKLPGDFRGNSNLHHCEWNKKHCVNNNPNDSSPPPKKMITVLGVIH